ncbi:hypothetical protein [Bradyrhizobium cosmicum]|uniref:Tip attachment protein J domain-containing protein n=1 Tax=Bradyrhizobium cosmicum TaxID=1404864 RepID=A0AAI8MBG4_9BRAD|nr:hypothetical protein [Bradyrhizobium cosmicum]BAL77023.1 hypothetical protein S23_38280 [Bradyrhizobium cosmicum]
MAETIGILILSSVEAAGVSGAAAFGTTAIVGTLTVNTVIGAAALTAASIGLQYALSNPQVPKPENGAQPLKQAVPPRQRGYWINRLSGYYMLFLGAGGDSQDVLAFHSGPIEQALQLYLHDTPVSVSAGLGDGQYNTVVPPTGIYYTNVSVQVFYGSDTQTVYGPIINSSTTSGVVTSAFQGKGTAAIVLGCGHTSDPTQFTKMYPQGLPLPSVVAKCAPVFDPRDVTQSRADRSTWKASPNPVLQLMDYLTEPDGGMGEDFDVLFPPAALALWMAEADLCDELVGGRARYQSAGFHQFDNAPESVINKILATCDGWMAENGDGSMALTVGVYREPSDPPLTSGHVLGWSWQKGQADEDSVNQLDITFTNPALGYVTDQTAPVRNEVAIAAAGIVRPQQLDLSWVQDEDQSTMLGGRALLRVNPAITGTLVTTLYGLRYLGRRWIKLQLPEVNGLADCVVEIQDKGVVELLNGRVTFPFILVDPVALSALQ